MSLSADEFDTLKREAAERLVSYLTDDPLSTPIQLTSRQWDSIHHVMALFAEAKLDAVTRERDEARESAENFEQALLRIVQWADAYPLDIFPEPDWSEARSKMGAELLSRTSASSMRRVVEGVGNIARAALTQQEHSDANPQ